MTAMTPEGIRERVEGLACQAENRDPREASEAVERLYWALYAVADELDNTVPGAENTVMFSQRRVCRDLCQVLDGIAVRA